MIKHAPAIAERPDPAAALVTAPLFESLRLIPENFVKQLAGLVSVGISPDNARLRGSWDLTLAIGTGAIQPAALFKLIDKLRLIASSMTAEQRLAVAALL
jgi:hypothetical protein